MNVFIMMAHQQVTGTSLDCCLARPKTSHSELAVYLSIEDNKV